VSHELSPDAIVVRFAPMKTERLIERAQRDAVGGRPRLSVFCRVQEEGQTVEELLEGLCAEAPVTGKNVWLSTVRRIEEEAGLELVHTPEPDCHYDVELSTGSLADAVARFESAFDPPRRNPAWPS
jgi:hypothetical protein